MKQNFQYLVKVDIDPKSKLFYSHKFPVAVGNRIEDRWSRKPLPPKNLTAFLRGIAVFQI